MRKDISVVHQRFTTIIDSERSILTFDAKSGESMKPVLCNCYFRLPIGFIQDIDASKIGKVDNDSIGYFWEPKNEDGCYFYITPQFGYTKQKLEDILCNLFEKYNL